MKGKKILIITIIIVLIIALIIVGAVLAYKTTDVLKTDEQLFYKYMADIGIKVSNIGSEELDAYIEKMRTTPYANESKLTVNVEVPKEMEDKLKKGYMDKVNDINITFSGKVDNANKRTVQDININYSDDVTFPINYKKDNNIYAITSSKLLKTYLGVKNDNLPKLCENLGLSQSNINIEIPNSIDTSILGMKKSDIINEMQILKSIVEENVTEANFSKVDDNSYALTLSERETITIATKIIEELKASNIISKNTKENLEGIEKKIKALNPKDTELVKIIVKKDGKITIMVKDKKALEILVKDTEIIITSRIEKTEFKETKDISVVLRKMGEGTAYTIDYTVSSGSNKQEINLEVQFSDIMSPKTKENYKVIINMESEGKKCVYQYDFETSKDFDQIIKLEAIKENDVFVLNNVGKDYINTLMNALGKVYKEVNKNQMQELGLEENENPLIFTTPIGYYIYENYQVIDNVNETIDEQAVAIFNATYEIYVGSQKGTTIKTLVQSVISSNSTNSEHKVSINGITEQTQLQDYINQINETEQYDVAIEKDASGYVNSIKIMEQM